SPQAIHSRAVQALNHNDPQALYAEMSPALKELFSLQEFISAEALAAGQSGAITQVEVLEPPALLTGPEWQGKWAQSTVRITRGAVSEIYLVRYVLEDGQWWLFGTLKQ
ncbi:MAG: hypothetical protein OEZ02_05720, partial [Anaerolineae bacterium]|nr:hypothetical protein [Anaerolineae bacterium]